MYFILVSKVYILSHTSFQETDDLSKMASNLDKVRNVSSSILLKAGDTKEIFKESIQFICLTQLLV